MSFLIICICVPVLGILLHFFSVGTKKNYLAYSFFSKLLPAS